MPRVVGYQGDWVSQRVDPVFGKSTRKPKAASTGFKLSAARRAAVLADLILGVLIDIGPAGASHIAAVIGRTKAAVATRMNGLRHDGLVEATGGLVKDAGGEYEVEWRRTP